MSERPEPYRLTSKEPFMDAMKKDGPLSEEVRHAVLMFMTTVLCHDPWKFGKQIKAPDKYAGKYLCRRETFKVVFTVDDMKKQITMCAVEAL